MKVARREWASKATSRTIWVPAQDAPTLRARIDILQGDKMLDERRRDERTEAYDIIRVIAKDAQGREVVLPIMLRDRSKTGLGGVYVGADPLDTSIDYWLEDVDAKLLRLRIAWISPVASHVFIVGFTII